MAGHGIFKKKTLTAPEACSAIIGDIYHDYRATKKTWMVAGLSEEVATKKAKDIARFRLKKQLQAFCVHHMGSGFMENFPWEGQNKFIAHVTNVK